MSTGILRHWAYFKYVMRHKYFVFRAGLVLEVPLWRLIIHDWSKFLPSEWFPYARCFYREDGAKQYCETPEFNAAWCKHIHRNDHHWQHWVLIRDNPEPQYLIQADGDWEGNTRVRDLETGIAIPVPAADMRALNSESVDRALRDLVRKANRAAPLSMPPPCIREMVADWAGAGRAITGKWDVVNWFEANKHKMALSPATGLRVLASMNCWRQWEREV